MLDSNEKLLQFIWQTKLLKPETLYTTSGTKVVVLKPGDVNHDAGPDFFNGQIEINGLVLSGNIELHVKTSDWVKHGHQTNKSYDNIILHVVYEHDISVAQNTLNNVEVLELKKYIPLTTIENYKILADAKGKLACAGQLPAVNEIAFISWMERMTIERLEDKVNRITTIFNNCNGDYAHTFYTILLRNFGFKVNSLPFELIARHLPVQILMQHKNNLFELEALLLGVSGMLEGQMPDNGFQLMQNEYVFLKKKYALTNLQKEIFKFSRLRPANFPVLRLAQFAALIYKSSELLTSPQNFTSFKQIKKMLKVPLEGYWKNHCTIGGRQLKRDLSMGDQSIENIIINSLAPFFFFYGKQLLKPAYNELALELLAGATFENNVKTRLFGAKQISLKTAAESQAIINLHDNYCVTKQCLKCGIGTNILRSA